MAERLDPDTKHGTSDFYYYPYCDSCHEEGRNVEPFSFCSDCDTFLCQRCHKVHARLPHSRTHTVQLGDDMPQGHAAEDVTYANCTKHANFLNDSFCLNHQEMVCKDCKSEFHNLCDVKSVVDACELIDFSGIDKVKDAISHLYKHAVNTNHSCQQNLDSVEDKRNRILSEMKNKHDKSISFINDLFAAMNTEVNDTFNLERSSLSDKIAKLSVLKREIGSSFAGIQNVDSSKVDPKSFISFQKILTAVRDNTKELEQITNSLETVDINLSISGELQAFLAHCKSFGQVNVKRYKLLSKTTFPELDTIFSVKTSKLVETSNINKVAGTVRNAPSNNENPNQIDEAIKQPKGREDHFNISPDLTQLRAVRQTSLFVQANFDLQDCYITGIAVRSNGQILVADNKNQNVKLFSSNGHLISSAKFSSRPWDVSVLNENSAVVSLEASGLAVLDLSSPPVIPIRLTINLGDLVWGIALCGTEIAVTCGSPPTVVKTIRIDGLKLWSIEKFSYGEKLGEHLDYVTSQHITKTPTLLVTDSKKGSISVLKADTGAVMRVCNLPGKKPKGIAVDKSGFVYVCYESSGEIAVWSTDLSETICLISDCKSNPKAIAYSPENHELIVSYKNLNLLDRYSLKSNV